MQKDQFKIQPLRRSDRELGIDPGRIRKWRQQHQKSDQNHPTNATLSDEQQQIRRLQRELREAQLERDILKSVYSVHAVE